MLRQRILVVLLLLPIGIAAIFMGGIYYLGLMVLLVATATWELAELFKTGGYQPSGLLMVAGVICIAVTRDINTFEYDDILITVIVLILAAYHLWQYEKGNDKAGFDYLISLGGIFYIGWLGGFFILIRNLPYGEWWLLIVLPATWLADSGGYFVGRKWGKNKMTPRLSPNKSWQGYMGGVLYGVIGTQLLYFLYQQLGLPSEMAVSSRGIFIISIAMAIFPTLGDLVESMFKRQVGVKDSGTVLPGHGGIFDRIDSWLWAAAIGYYLIIYFI